MLLWSVFRIINVSNPTWQEKKKNIMLSTSTSWVQTQWKHDIFFKILPGKTMPYCYCAVWLCQVQLPSSSLVRICTHCTVAVSPLHAWQCGSGTQGNSILQKLQEPMMKFMNGFCAWLMKWLARMPTTDGKSKSVAIYRSMVIGSVRVQTTFIPSSG